ncbi:MAG: D-glycero-beta-D-manno-heptose 1,7-bisphosphate 7-phosphatase [Gammaproteobacteria bacterium]|nr:D-glycero-beta-D-manno-heptose 1,7-bisphosphate 7-phosphatase [Gammaproteobacteria bacterium]MBU6509300.1 D-glycero-beta-D-manno-heptose 1,7-bisphosphate 7-phosphatase [Gammaproteobacteria bacterium]MDE1983499.1 D-glycero-beta-D-manno-heptose 1,7-bisphosphate 7-phosphatase [Gammaproteobacteria bacterium]MDE2107914.1 D-glycero-beta-D-manno-heptose 1,7-bisphosphate 7-phosphatase [Gammaproteobacteria bacterium]MDE2460265.1 D-glycero-beta-D-manno-heptose 1,7-bisphosphate 7-phosphatase [Gammaprot
MRLVILDRDGVINYDSDAYIKSPEEWRPIPGSLEAIANLTHAGFTVTVASNQAGVARGLFDLDTLAAIHRKMQAAVEQAGGELAGIFYCPHGPDDGCDCRKPKPGLLKQIAQDFGTSLHGVPAVGDSLRDIEAAESVGARPILVRTGKGEITLASLGDSLRVEVFKNLAAAAEQLLREAQA